jgi:glyoxylase-like metal-dependent hydrolase (beta-lactamase superfamily II)
LKVHADTRPLTAPLAGGSEGASVAVEPLRTGQVQMPPALLENAGRLARLRATGVGTPRSRWGWVPAGSFLVHHPTAGPFVIDTGLHPSIAARPAANLGRLLAWWARPRLEPGEDLPAQLRARGIDSKAIRVVVMTHLHYDHASAMSEFPGATFVVSEPEWVVATTERRPLLHGYRPAHYDYAFDYRTLRYDGSHISSYASFGRTFDLFGDGSVRLAFAPGHSAGHQAVVCRLADRDLVIAGDALYNQRQLADAPLPPRPADPHTFRRSLQELRLFRRQYPQAPIVPSHDAVFWETIAARYE